MSLKNLNYDNSIDLNKLGSKYGTDKVDINHSYKGITYLDIYHRYMGASRLRVKTFIEIGVCGGQSLKMWKEYFPNATIYGIDIDPSCRQHAEERIEIIIGDQNDDNFLKSLAEKFKDSIDILLDDGSHITKHQIKTYSYLYPCIKSGGLFIIEDLANSYEEWVNDINLRDIWPGMIYNKPNDELKNYREDFNTFINSVVKKLDLNKINKHDTHMVSIHFYPMIVIFENC